jgi:hypothetical protein
MLVSQNIIEVSNYVRLSQDFEVGLNYGGFPPKGRKHHWKTIGRGEIISQTSNGC